MPEEKEPSSEEVIEWLLGNSTGTSSLTILAFMQGKRNRRESHPSDPSDLGRCIGLLDAFPAFRNRLHEMKSKSPEWAALIENWAEIEALYLEESPSGTAPKCYARMKELIGHRAPDHHRTLIFEG